MSAVLPTPSARLAQSRAQLRQALHQAAAAATTDGRPSTSGWLDELRADPGVSLVAGVLGHWWSGHPLRLAGALVARATTAAVQPIAQRHPVGVLAGAFIVGGLLAWTRPWRWSRAALWTGLLPQLLMAAVGAAPTRPVRTQTR